MLNKMFSPVSWAHKKLEQDGDQQRWKSMSICPEAIGISFLEYGTLFNKYSAANERREKGNINILYIK